MIHFLSAILLIILAFPATAQNKCKQSDGTTVYQQAACANSTKQESLRVFAAPPEEVASSARPNFRAQINELDRKQAIRDAIAAGRPMVTMTREELQLAMGSPDKLNAAQYGSRTHDQLIYYRNGRTLFVYTENGVVSSIQNTEGTATATRQRQCPTATQIRDIEIEQSKLANRDDAELQSNLAARLLDAKSCR